MGRQADDRRRCRLGDEAGNNEHPDDSHAQAEDNSDPDSNGQHGELLFRWWWSGR